MVLLPASVAPTGCESVGGVGGGRRRVRGDGTDIKSSQWYYDRGYANIVFYSATLCVDKKKGASVAQW